MSSVRLTTRRVDAFNEHEDAILTIISSEGTAWFTPGLSYDKRRALSDLQRLGHIFPTTRNRPPEAPRGSVGYRITDQGRDALAEVARRAGKS